MLLDEQTSREVARRLSELCDVERVVTVPELGAGADDDEIRTYAVENDRNVVTEGPDFIDGSAGPGASTYPKVIFCTDRSSEAIDMRFGNSVDSTRRKTAPIGRIRSMSPVNGSTESLRSDVSTS